MFVQVLAVIVSVLCERAVDVGLGRHIATISSSDLESYYRLTYAAAILGIFAMVAAKASIAMLYERIAPRQDARGINLLSCCIGAWAVLALFGQAFQCGATVAFQPQHCTTGGAIQYPIIAFNIVTDAMLAFWMAPRIWSLQSERKNRVVPIVLFATRILVCIAALAQIAVFAHNLRRVDQTWAAVVPWTLTMCVMTNKVHVYCY